MARYNQHSKARSTSKAQRLHGRPKLRARTSAQRHKKVRQSDSVRQSRQQGRLRPSQVLPCQKICFSRYQDHDAEPRSVAKRQRCRQHREFWLPRRLTCAEILPTRLSWRWQIGEAHLHRADWPTQYYRLSECLNSSETADPLNLVPRGSDEL